MALSASKTSPGGDPMRVVVTAEHPDDGRQLARLFGENGMQPVRDGGLLIVAVRTMLAPELGRINRVQLRRRQPWLLMRSGGERVCVGPLFFPGRTGCWECLAHRLRQNRWTDSDERADPLVVARGVAEIRRWPVPESSFILGRILVFTNLIEEPEIHELTRRPQCSACGRATTRRGRAIHLESRMKVPQSARTCPVDDTLNRLARHVSDLTGIVSHVRPAAGWQASPIYLAEHCRPLTAAGPEGFPQLPPQPVVGKGATEKGALASCLAEAVERYSIQWHGDEAVRQARPDVLGAKAIGLRELALWSARQMRSRTRWNREIGGFSYIPRVPQKDARIEWTAVWSLTFTRWKYVPAAYCYLYYPKAGWLADSNGCATGNVMEEAILHGFLELVEREAVGIWWYNRLQRPAVEVDGPMGTSFETVRRELQGRGRGLTVLDLTTDFGIPVFAAVSAHRNGKRIAIGTGGHLDPELALSQALGELCQVVHGLETGLPKSSGRLTTVEQALHRWTSQARVKEHPYLIPGNDRIRLSEFPNRSRQDLRQEVKWCIERARTLGLEVLVLDMSRRDIDFPVVRVIVPGMRHCWARLAPGRLYDVPVKMGWLKRRLREDALNPEAYFL